MGTMGHDHAPSSSPRNRIAIAFAIIAVFLVVQIIGALASGSLALLADSAHMSSDAIGLLVALIASILALRPATERHTFGFRRVEVLGAAVNGLILSVVAILVAIEAVRRLLIPDELVEPVALPMLIVAIVGLCANIAAFLVLRGGDRNSLNLRGALLEVVGDTLGSIAAIVAAIVLLLTGFAQADAIASLVIAALIVPRAAVLLRDVVRVLILSVPRETDIALIRSHLAEEAGVVAVHDVHVWSITTGSPVFSAHVQVDPAVLAEGRTSELLTRLQACLEDHFDVAHSTFQLEPAGHSEEPTHR